MQPIVEELRSLIRTNNWQDAFRLAIERAQEGQIPEFARYRDHHSLLKHLDELVKWAPRVEGDPVTRSTGYSGSSSSSIRSR